MRFSFLTSVDATFDDRHFYDVSGENWIQTLLWFAFGEITQATVCVSTAGRQEGLVQTGMISVHCCHNFKPERFKSRIDLNRFLMTKHGWAAFTAMLFAVKKHIIA